MFHPDPDRELTEHLHLPEHRDHVPYCGAGQAINDLIAGHVRVAFLGPTALIPHYKAEKLRLLAQSAETRSPNLPEVPTLQEAGFKGLVLETWYAAFVPLGTPTL